MISKPVKDTCTDCGKIKFLANKSKKLCTTCVAIRKRTKDKETKELVKKPVKKTTVKTKPFNGKKTVVKQAALDQITSRLVRLLYPSLCPHCKIKLDSSNANCGHFVSRVKQSTRFSLKNLVAVDRTCNFYRPEHVYTLGKFLDTIWGEGTADEQILLGNKKLKFTNEARKALYTLYTKAYEKAQNLSQIDKYKFMKEIQMEYEKIIKDLFF